MIHTLATIELRKEDHQDIAEKVAALKAEQDEKADTLAGTLANIDKAIKQWELAKKVAMEQESEPDIAEAIRNLKRLRADRAGVEQEVNKATSEVSELEECSDLLDCAKRDWNGMKFEKKRRLVKLVVGYANVEAVSPHIIKLTVALVEPLNVVFQCYTWRERSSRPDWTESENEVLRKLYPRADRAIILEALPLRNWDAIIMQAAHVLKLHRETRHNTSSLDDRATYADEQVIKGLGSRSWPIITVDTNLENVRSFIVTNSRRSSLFVERCHSFGL